MPIDYPDKVAVEIDGEIYDSEYIGENPEEFVLSTDLYEYRLDEVELELRGLNGNKRKKSLKLLEELYEEKDYSDRDGRPKLVIKDGKGPGLPLMRDRLEDIGDMLEKA